MKTAAFFDNFNNIKNRISKSEVFIFLDYDGTLTPIADTPDQAIISDEMKKAVEDLAACYQIAIISGRATDDVRHKVGVKDIFYAGSHGFEIVYPNGDVHINTEAEEIRPTIKKIYGELKQELKNISGALVEDVKFTVSVHYRLVDEKEFENVFKIVEEVLSKYENLRKTDGKMVIEVRPKIDWDKGKAVEWILKNLNFDPAKNEVIYIGDDKTDEDAFCAIKGKGIGILVSESIKETNAEYFVQNTEDVKSILKKLIDLKQRKIG